MSDFDFNETTNVADGPRPPQGEQVFDIAPSDGGDMRHYLTKAWLRSGNRFVPPSNCVVLSNAQAKSLVSSGAIVEDSP